MTVRVSTGGEQGFEVADGSGTGFSLTAVERARPVAERPILATERRVFCLRCAWSAPIAARTTLALSEHLAGHPGAVAREGDDWARGYRYGPLTGRRRRGRPKVLPPLRMRSGAGVETAERTARRIRAGLATKRRLRQERAAAGNAAGG
jgi:hypothetical protein